MNISNETPFGSCPIRFSPYAVYRGHENMTIDSELAVSSAKNQNTYIRFYGWRPNAVSLGFNQSSDSFSKYNMIHDGIDLVKRPTGGRAVFHAEELTYCITTPTSGPDENRKIYRDFHIAIATALAQLGIETDFVKANPDLRQHYSTSGAKSCFTSSARYELTIGGRKLVGSAQRDFGKVLLQHGSILLGPRHYDICEYMDFDGDSDSATEEKKLRFRSLLEKSSTDVKTSTGKTVSPDLLADKIIEIIKNHSST
jgi:lipoate-protein ligase A